MDYKSFGDNKAEGLKAIQICFRDNGMRIQDKKLDKIWLTILHDQTTGTEFIIELPNIE
jgi:hypothetical protein